MAPTKSIVILLIREIKPRIKLLVVDALLFALALRILLTDQEHIVLRVLCLPSQMFSTF